MPRYIDADALIQHIENLQNINSEDDCFCGNLQAFKSILNFQPTADVVDRNECSKCVFYPFRQLREQQETNVVDVVRGEWQVYYDEDSPQDGVWKCSMCDYIRLVDDITPMNYCPNCGADMRGGTE